MAFDPDIYLARIGYSGPVEPTFPTLRAIQRAHIHAIPFENLDPLRGVAPSLEIGDLTAKLVDSTDRGGYCYEHNTLYGTALRALGFRVTSLAARVRSGARPGDLRPRTHMLMLAEAPGDPQPYLTDVGFGSIGALLDAVPLIADVEFDDVPRRHRLVHEEPHEGPLEVWVLQSSTDGEWKDQYSFTLDPYYAPDFEVINFHVARNPRSPFSGRLFAQRTLPDRHLALDTRKVTETSPEGVKTVRELADDAEALDVLAKEFGIVAPDGVLGRGV